MDVFFEAVEPVYRHATAGGTVVTSNTRAARFLLNLFAQHEREAGKKAWQQADVLSWDAWTARLWNGLLLSGHDERIVLSGPQQHAAWETVLSPHGRSALAGAAQSAWQLLWGYADGPQALERFPHRDDTADFREWCAAFTALLRARGWVSGPELPHVLASLAMRIAATAPPVMLYAFDRLTPAQQVLHRALAQRMAVQEFHPELLPEAGEIQKTSFADMPRGVEAAAWWARRQIEAAPGGKVKLAIVTPRAAAARGEAQRTFSRVLGEDAFQFSLGTPLAYQPVAADALLLLRWLCGPLPLHATSQASLSPYLGRSTGETMSLRAQLDAAARRDCNLTLPEYSLAAFAAEVRKKTSVAGHPFHQMEALSRSVSSASRFAKEQGCDGEGRLPSHWAALFAQYLSRWRFALPAGATRREVQAMQGWQSLLEEFATLDFDGEPRSLNHAVQALERMAHETIFQTAARADTPVEIMGPLEAAGSLFDAIFFLDANEGAWPLPGPMDPLLPSALQRQTGMPHGSSEIDFRAAEQVTHRLMRSARAVLFTWPQMDSAGPMRPSFLLRGVNFVSESWSSELGIEPDATEDKTELDRDVSPLPWTPERGKLSATSLKQQSTCPFQAFAAQRLAANGLESREDGMDPRARGNLLHAVLQSVWCGTGEPAGLRDSKGLELHTKNGTLRDFVRAHALAVRRRDGSGPWQDAFYSLEVERVTNRILEWLAVEAKRTAFRVVAVEKQTELELAGLEFSLRIDRIDELLDGEGGACGKLLLDYKTGTIASEAWKGERMAEPQLPLYSLAFDSEELLGVGFASLKVNCVEFKGAISQDALRAVPAEKPEKLEDSLPRWHRALTVLAEDFHAGHAAVDPRKINSDCRYCDFPTLCRVAENLHALAEQDEREPYET